MKIKFVQDYRGIVTDEQFYQVGDVVDFDKSVALKLIEDSRAAPVIIRATPAATKYALENGIDLATIKGSGSAGSITVKDLQ